MVVVGGGSRRSELATAQLVFEIAQLVQGALAAALLFGRRNGWRRWRLKPDYYRPYTYPHPLQGKP
jgi:hypothetical protein